MWGFFILGIGVPRGLRRAVRPEFHIPFVGRWDALGFLQDFFAARRAARHHRRSRSSGCAPSPRSYGRDVALLRLAHRRRLADPVHDLPGHPDLRDLPRRRGQHLARLPVRLGRVLLRTAWAQLLAPLGHTANESIETVALLRPHRRHAGLPADRAALQAPAHRPGPDQRHLQAAARRPGPAAADGVRAASRSTSRIPPRTPCSAAARSRTSPGRACSTSPPAPSAAAASRSARRGTPESRCRPSSSSWTCATTCSPRRRTSSAARRPRAPLEAASTMETRRRKTGHHVPESGFDRDPRARAPSRPPARSSAPLEQGGVIDPDVLWSCTTCGACVEQCPVDIEHIDHIVDMRRYQVHDRVGVPGRARRAVQEPGEQGQPLGPERQGPHQLDRRGRLRRPGLRPGRRHLRRLRVPVLGRLRRRLRGPRQEDHQGRRRTAARSPA